MYRVRVRVRVRVRDRDRDRVRNRVMSECGALVVHLRMCGRRRELRTAQLSSKRAMARARSARRVPGCAKAAERAADAAAEAQQAREMPRGIWEPPST